MTDSLSVSDRSHRMGLVRGKNTKPEIVVRSIVHRAGFRYRLHVGALPGTPDLVFPGRRRVIFVHGCFWHRHQSPSCRLARLPKSKLEFWEAKLEGNRKRDVQNTQRLRREGWKVLQIWECELKNQERVERRIRKFLE